MISIGSLYIANILYFFILIKDIIITKKIKISRNIYAKTFYFLFIIWVTISTIFSFNEYKINFRTLIQYLFTLQCIILILPINLNSMKFEYWIYKFSVILSAFILLLFVYFFWTSPNTLNNDLWAIKYIPGWPNSPPIPLLVGLWLSFEDRKNIFGKLIIYSALLITGSRIAFLGGIIIALYFILKRSLCSMKYKVILILVFSIGLLGLNYLILNHYYFIKTLTFSTDRVDIFFKTISLVEKRPFLGYGGRTLDQLNSIKTNFLSMKEWPHTHNWFLEILLRYGIIGSVLFSGYLFSIFFNIKDKDRKFMFLLLLILAFFQIYIRDFVFLFFLYYFSIYPHSTISIKKNGNFEKTQ